MNTNDDDVDDVSTDTDEEYRDLLKSLESKYAQQKKRRRAEVIAAAAAAATSIDNDDDVVEIEPPKAKKPKRIKSVEEKYEMKMKLFRKNFSDQLEQMTLDNIILLRTTTKESLQRLFNNTQAVCVNATHLRASRAGAGGGGAARSVGAGGASATLETWLDNKNNLYVGRHGRVPIGRGDNKRIFVYKGSIWANPFSVKEYGLANALELYKQYLVETGLDQIIETLLGKNLGCWCEPGNDCHAGILIEMLREKYGHS